VQRPIKKAALSRLVDHDLPFSTWSLAKLADFPVAEGWSTTSAMNACGSTGGRVLSVMKTWKQSSDPDFEAKKNRILRLYGADDRH
jgi:hypothetical protein